ncbi:MAG: GAP family protein [Euryarchaeota archaeon]|nr:GAP family protein [Euryarchaeota archaeon]
MSLIGDVLPLAIGVAVSPVPIIAIILMLLSKRAKRNSLSFLFGWIVGLAIVGSVVLFAAQTQDLSTGTGPSVAASVMRFALGVLLLFLAYRQWTKRPRPGHEPPMPKWLHSIDSVTPMRALGLALLLSAVNPKNLTLTLAAALAIAQSTLGSVQSVIALALFVVIASVSVAAPVILYFILGPKAAHTLDELRVWLTQNNATVVFILLLVFGAILIAEGINGIT